MGTIEEIKRRRARDRLTAGRSGTGGRATVSAGFLKKLAQLTEDNDHTGEAIELAKLANDKQALEILRAIVVVHAALGPLPHDLVTLRHRMRVRVIERLERNKPRVHARLKDAGAL